MEFAGKLLASDSATRGADLAARLRYATAVSDHMMDEEVSAMVMELDGAAKNNVDEATAFVLTMADSCESSPTHDFATETFLGTAATAVAINVMQTDVEMGKRLVHDLLTRENQSFAEGSWNRVESEYLKGRICYDDYHRLLLVRRLF